MRAEVLGREEASCHLEADDVFPVGSSKVEGLLHVLFLQFRILAEDLLHMTAVYKFDIFPTTFFAHGEDEVRRRVFVKGTALAEAGAVPMVSPEDIILAKLAWFRNGGETSERQWQDLTGIWRMHAATLDGVYLEEWAAAVCTDDLLRRLTA